jgi:hypothetical protein
VKKDQDKLRGHSWLELDGQRRWDPQAQVAYAVTFSYPPDLNPASSRPPPA